MKKLTLKQIEKIKLNINNEKSLMKNINNQNYYTIDNFVDDVVRYIKAIESNRMFCVIDSVSSSGMSRNIHFHEFIVNKEKKGYILQFWTLFKVLGYTEVKGSQSFRIGGCGMDMIFHTNYSNIRTFYKLGFLKLEDSKILEQNTPAKL